MSGRDALFSTAERRPATLVVECESCRVRTRMTYADLVRRSLPLPLWMPWRRYSRRLRCPVCEEPRWLAMRWFD